MTTEQSKNAALATDERIISLYGAPLLKWGVPFGPGSEGVRILSPHVDDAERDFGLALYDRMDNEPVLGGSHGLYRTMVMQAPWSVVSAVERKPGRELAGDDAARADRADEIAGFIRTMLAQMETPMRSVLWSAYDARRVGHKLFEQVRDRRDGKVVVKALKPKPRTNYSFVSDGFLNVFGVVPRAGALMLDLAQMPKDVQQATVPMEDLFVATMNGGDGDPRGRAGYRHAYAPWYEKQQTRPTELKNNAQFGGAIMSVTFPPLLEGQSGLVVTSDGRTISRYEDAVEQAAKLVAGGVFCSEGTLTIHAVNAGGSLQATFDRCDREMVVAYLFQARATQEAEHGSKADSGDANNLLAQIINYGRIEVPEQFTEQVIRPIVAVNYGEADARDLCPSLRLALAREEDIPALLTAVSTGVSSGVILPSQRPHWDSRLGQPSSTPEEIAAHDAKSAPALPAPTLPAEKP